MKISLYLDEDSSAQSLAKALRTRGVTVVTTLDVGMATRDDDEQLDWATAQGYVLCSFNKRDFFRLHTEYLMQGRSHAGIILTQQQQFSIGEQLRRLLNLINAKSAEEMKDQVEFLSAWG
jgi:hypothetical protein